MLSPLTTTAQGKNILHCHVLLLECKLFVKTQILKVTCKISFIFLYFKETQEHYFPLPRRNVTLVEFEWVLIWFSIRYVFNSIMLRKFMTHHTLLQYHMQDNTTIIAKVLKAVQKHLSRKAFLSKSTFYKTLGRF